MLFVTLQDFPEKTWIDEKGHKHREEVRFNDVPVPVNKSLGFSPLWAIPVTTLRETMASLILAAPNYPQLFCLFETEDYVRVDKVKWYKNIKNGDYATPLADQELPDYLTEYCLRRETLPRPIQIVPVTAVVAFLNYSTGIESVLGFSKNMNVSSEITEIVRQHIRHVPEIDITDLRRQLEVYKTPNTEARSVLMYSWYVFKYTILPVLIWPYCADNIGRKNAREIQIDFRLLEACSSTINQLMAAEREMTFWSRNSCEKTEFEHIYNRVYRLILDSVPVMESLFLGKKIGRNDFCPCGSGKKFKKCHGFYL